MTPLNDKTDTKNDTTDNGSDPALASGNEKLAGNTTEGNKPQDSKPGNAKPGAHKSQGNIAKAGNPGGNKPQNTNPGGGKPGGNKPQDNKPKNDNPGGNKPQNNKPEGNKPQYNNPGGGKPGDNKPEGNSPGGNKPQNHNPGSGKPGGSKPQNNKPEGDNPGGNKPQDNPPKSGNPETGNPTHTRPTDKPADASSVSSVSQQAYMVETPPRFLSFSNAGILGNFFISLILNSNKKQIFYSIVAVPWLLMAAYYYIFAADQFVSEASFSIREPGSGSSGANASALAAMTGFSDNRDEHVVEKYILSMDMLLLLDQELQLREHYSAHPRADFWSRLNKKSSLESFLKFYRKHISTRYDDLSGLLVVEVKTYDPEYAQRLLETILHYSEILINQKSRELAFAQLDFVQAEIKESERRLVRARQALINFQNKHSLFNPEQHGQSVSSIIASLEANLAATRAEYRQLLSYQHQSSPQAVTLRNKIKSLEEQIEQENARLVSQAGDQSINQIFGEFKELELEVQVAQETYASALTALEQSRMEASRQLKYLMVISEPFLPQEALYPRKLYNLLTLAVILLMLFGITTMLITTVKEHHD